MAYMYFARRELGQGRVAPAQRVFFGSAFSVRMEYTGAQTITPNENRGNRPPGGLRKGAEIHFGSRCSSRAMRRAPRSSSASRWLGSFSMDLVR